MANLQVNYQPLPSVYVLDNPSSCDDRGNFTKFFHATNLAKQGISFTPAESFLTRSKKGVLRGMHFQIGVAAHKKLVTCVKGRVLDVIVDINPNSQYFNQPFSMELSEKKNISLLIDKNYAHGFLALDDDSWMLYSTSTMHDHSLDKGILWSSINFDWPIINPILSARDKAHPGIG